MREIGGGRYTGTRTHDCRYSASVGTNNCGVLGSFGYNGDVITGGYRWASSNDRTMTISELNIRLERDVALSLGIPMYGADPRLVDMGSKTGCRRMFEECEVQYPIGAEDLHSVDDIVAAVQGMRARRPSIKHAIVKINEGVSGSGNASMDLDDLPAPGSPDEAAAIAQRLQHIRPEAETLSVEVFLAAFEKDGGIVEERITGVALESPSVQMRALPDGTVELLSTHDQLLGGASGQKYLGCVFPADPGYAAAIAEPAMVVGRHLAQRGVLGRFAVDFVTVKDETGEWTPYAIELNLRKGGTTHPFLTLQFLCGNYDGERGVFVTPKAPASTWSQRTISKTTGSKSLLSRTFSMWSCNTECTSTNHAAPVLSST